MGLRLNCMQCRQPEISCRARRARFIIPARPRDNSEDPSMCGFGGIAGALGAAAFACAVVIGATQAEPVAYHAGDIFVTQLDAPPECAAFDTRVDTRVFDVDQNAPISVDRSALQI